MLLYLPELVATALNTTAGEVQTYALQAYQGSDYDGNADTILTAWLGWIPSDQVDNLQAMIKAPNSAFYSASGILGELASTVDSSFSLTSFASQKAAIEKSNAATSSGSSSGTTKKTKTIIIAVVVSCGVLILALCAYFAIRATKSGAIALPGSPSARHEHANRDRLDPRLRSFQLGQGHRDSGSTISTISSGGYDGRSGHAVAGSSAGRAASHGLSSSVDHSNERGSWWRFSGQSAGAGPNAGMSPGEMREGPRRINVVRGRDGHLDQSQFSRPVIQSNSLML